ncbi:hypothetical protein J4Q44_G00201490 [Coregonus suidteri]|uniref:COMM domain-containing protein n=1 Tax=Coregonus suidteri TaxID=861788 RepID=A0AAN8LUT9_9TELE
MISEVDFQDSVLGFTEELNQLQLYLDHMKEIRHILSVLTHSLPRPGVEAGCTGTVVSLPACLLFLLASRALRHQVKPTLSMKLHLEESGGEKSAKVLQTDPATLMHLIQDLEKALAELKTTHCRRIRLNIK